MPWICAAFIFRESTLPASVPMLSSAVTTSVTASSTVKKKRRISGPVVPMTPVSACIFFQSGSTEPVDHATLP